MNSNRTWKFFRAGGFDQVKLETGSDLMALDQLDQKLWVALACPTTGLHFDSRTLALIDTDKDGRVRAPELIAAVKWAGNSLKNPDDLVKAPAPLPLAAINGLAFAFKDYPTVWAAMDGELGAFVRDAIGKVNLHVFDRCLDNGFRNITTSTKPAPTPWSPRYVRWS